MLITWQADPPESVTSRDPPLTLLIVSTALFGPGDVGWKLTVTVALAPGASEVAVGRLTPKWGASGPVMVKGSVSVTTDGSVFVMVIVVETSAPIVTVPKLMSDTLTAMPPLPMPDNAIDRDPAVLATVSDALFGPPLAGWKATMTVVASPAPSVVAPGVPTEKDEASAPPMVNGDVSVTGTEVLLVTVTVAVVVNPTAMLPKLTAVGEAPMPGVTALARFCGSLGPDLKSAALLFVSTWLPSRPPIFRS